MVRDHEEAMQMRELIVFADATLQLIDNSHLQLHRDAASLTPRPLMNTPTTRSSPASTRRSSSIVQSKSSVQVPHEVEESVAADVDPPKAWALRREYPLSFGGKDFRVEGGAGITAIQRGLECLEPPPHDLHVLG
jgi:hypothetical protein